MFVIASEALIQAPPWRVWTLLTTFERYGAWTNSLRLTGNPKAGQGLEHRVMLQSAGGRLLPVSLPTTIQEAETCRVLTWRWRFPALLSLRFSYELEAVPEGTRLRHELEVAGLLSQLARGRFERLLGPIIRRLVADATRASEVRGAGSRGRRR